jgi:hypothetical protein
MWREALLVRRGMLCTLKKKLVRKIYKHVFVGKKCCHVRCERLTLGMVGSRAWWRPCDLGWQGLGLLDRHP